MKLLRDLFIEFAEHQAKEDDLDLNTSSDDSEDDLPPKKNPHGKRDERDFPNADTKCHHHKDLNVGDTCPKCIKGKLYHHKQEGNKVRALIRITGHVPLQATIHKFYDLRCNFCKNLFKIEFPEDLAKARWRNQEIFK